MSPPLVRSFAQSFPFPFSIFCWSNSTQSPGILSFFRLWGSRVEMVFRWESWEVQRDQKAYSASNIVQSFDKAVSSIDHGQFYGQFACFFTTKPGERVDLIILSCPQVWFLNGIFRFGDPLKWVGINAVDPNNLHQPAAGRGSSDCPVAWNGLEDLDCIHQGQTCETVTLW